MDTNLIIFILLAINFLLIVFLYAKTYFLKKRISELFGSKSSGDIEKTLNDYVKGVKHYFSDVEELKDFSHKLFQIGERSIQKIGFVRFNPFDEVGGNQSFSIAFLDLNNNGVLLTSLFGRDGTRIYSKLIKGGKSDHYLSDEEKKALEKAIKINPVK